MNRRNHKYGTPIGITIMNMMMMMVLRDDVFGCSMSRWCGCATSLPLLPVASAAAWIAAIPPPAGRLLPGGASAAFLHQRRPLASTTKTTRLWGDGGSPATAASSTTTATTGSGGSSSYTLDGQDIRGPIVPVGNILVVKVKDTLTATGGGILLPDQSKQRPTEGLVVAAGPGRIHPHTAVRIVNPVSTGVSVVYGKFDGKPIEYNGEECQVIRDDNVLLSYTGVTLRLDTVIPVRDYVLIQLDGNTSGAGGDQPVMTSSGVVIAAAVLKDNAPCEGRVVKIGEGRMASTGQLTQSPVRIGDMVKFKDYAGNDVLIEGKAYSVVKMVDILCTFTAGDETTAASE